MHIDAFEKYFPQKFTSAQKKQPSFIKRDFYSPEGKIFG